jgi:hypothetical protein
MPQGRQKWNKHIELCAILMPINYTRSFIMDNTSNEKQWQKMYLIGAVSSFTAMLVMIAEIFITALPDGAPVQLTMTKLLEMYNRNWFMGMRYMGLMNIFASTLLIPVFISLYGVHRKTNRLFAPIALIISLIGYIIFMSDNVAFPILELSRKYSLSDSESEKMMILSAVEALFAKGASHTPGTFPGFFIGQIASIFFCIVIISGKIFKKKTGIIGLIAFIFLLIFEIVASFIKSLFNQAMIFAVIGGISAIIWYILVGLELINASKTGK